MSTTVQGKFDYIVLLSPTFIRNKTYVGFAENDRDLLILTPIQGQINNWLKIISYVYAGTNTLIILDDCATARDVKQRTNELVNYAFSARHKESAFGSSQSRSKASKNHSENTAALVLFYTPTAKNVKIIFEDCAGELIKDELME